MSFNKAFRSCVTAAVAALSLVAVQAAESPAQSTPTQLSVDDHRPLAAMVRQMEKQQGWVVTYEDPPYLHASQMVDVTASVSRVPSSSHRVFVPRKGVFIFQYRPPPVAASQGQVLGILNDMIQQYSQTGNDGEFRVFESGGVHHVVPTTVRRKSGSREGYASRLDVEVTIPETTDSLLNLLVQFGGAVRHAGGTRLGLSLHPMMNALNGRQSRFAASGEPARTVLLRLLQASGLRISWQLLCQPGDEESCSLNLHEVSQSGS